MGSTGAQSNSLVGTLLGKDYLVLDQIGRGGMAVVYLVEHQTLQKRFAAKVLSADHASSAEARARFTQEAHAASQLDHENIVSISDFGVTADQRPFFVMELLRGQTLDVRIEEGPMTIEEVVAVAVPVARALAHAHAEGIIHRDVKPENVFLVQRSQGRWGVKVLDFGIAKVPVNQHLTAMGQTLGSPMFMSPEACRGEDVDQRADIYSFGILLYLMLAGRVPFQDESLLKILQMQVTSPLPSPREFNPDISPEIEAVIVRALAKDPDDRYASMDDLLLDLEAALPEGSDSLLILAQFGTASLRNTPFPGTLDRVRQSQRMARFSQSSMPAASRSASQPSLPAAPKKSNRGLLIAIGSIGALAVAGIWGYGWWRQQQEDKSAVAAPAPAQVAQATPPPPVPAAVVEPPPVAAVEPPPVEPPPVEPPPVEPPAVTEETPEDPPAAASKATPKKTAKKPTPPAKPAVATAAKPTPPEVPKAGSAAKPPDKGSAAPPAGSAAVAVVTPPAPPVEKKPLALPPDAAVPTPAPPKPVVNVGSLDATPVIASLDVNGPLPGSVVRRAIERALPALRTCYKTAAKAAQKTPAVNVSLTFEVDENSGITNAYATGAKLGTLDSCARGAISRVQTQQAPDVGTAHVTATISFRPI